MGLQRTFCIALLISALQACAPRLAPPASHCANAEQSWHPTDDGGTIHLHHHPADGPPVLVVHGIASNHHAWDLSPERSLAVALNEAGLDAWLLDLRGHGDARRDGEGKIHRRGANLDTYATEDLSTAIAHILHQTGHDQLGYVGHSLGGMILAANQSLSASERAPIGAAVVVGTPIDFGDPDPLLKAARASMSLGTLLPRVNVPFLARSAATLPRLPFKVESLLFNMENLDPDSRKEMYRRIVSPLYAPELRQLRRSVAKGHLSSADGKTNYEAALSRFDAPLLVIAGAADQVAPPERVKPYFDGVASTEKAYLLAGPEAGFSHAYGHVDLTIGDSAPAEIYPRITGWLASYLATEEVPDPGITP